MRFRSPVHAGSAIVVALIAIAASCGHPRRHAIVPPPPARTGTTETGIASWYGIPYHGRQTASGEVYDMHQLTAAHRNLPFQTWVEVENLTNGMRVEVRINDRGPFVGGRIIDLSQTAADRIGMLGPGTARVRLTVIAGPSSPAPEKPAPFPESSPASRTPAASIVAVLRYAVQAGAFADRERAESLRANMTEAFADARTLGDFTRNPPLWRVLVGREMTMEQASSLADRVRDKTGAALVVPEPVASPQ
ncbi:MAG TPA: septal ring lytic transglycosylase RlpA family protein [Bryobacteraceae bacterium]|nr:septal ring lytic transglycosylase RlpA family protein [Bryobacteraceae bacterium]